MDEIDAALDFRNVSIIGQYIKAQTTDAQFIIISLRYNMFELSERLVGVYKVNNMSHSLSINPNRYTQALSLAQSGEMVDSDTTNLQMNQLPSTPSTTSSQSSQQQQTPGTISSIVSNIEQTSGKSGEKNIDNDNFLFNGNPKVEKKITRRNKNKHGKVDSEDDYEDDE
ncbi:MAG: putative Structural maintenance of chromosomes protein 4 [Streblomastix strix]|uniref:Putative Structural maintenance of chromosomes protein 4 n=1 Tax=Streblomastix strix TaxID=222440 RepID=A0A5J4U197_9EUKA|nr:MAG: putative Structural maintenance of chromosomes protein 4 [Streblomastix strix]